MGSYYWLTQTMLIERLVGVFTYAGLFVAMYFIVRNTRSHKTLCRALNIYIAILCVMAFFYIPPESADLHRWRVIFDKYNWGGQTFIEFFKSELTRSSTPVAYTIMYLCNLTGFDGILPSVCTLVFYGNVFYILKDLHLRHNVSTWSISTTLFVFMSAGSFVEVVSGVRCMVALSILARCFYNEMYNNKSILKGFVWEVAAALIHSLAAVLLVGRLCFWMFQKSQRKTMLANIVLAVVVAMVFLSFGQNYVVSAFERAVAYIFDEDSYNYMWENLIRIILLLQMCFILFAVQHKNASAELKNVIKFCMALIVLDVAFAFNHSIFHRVSTFVLLMMLPVIADAADRSKFRNLDVFLEVYSLVILALCCTRGTLCGYKFFLL